MIAVRLATHEDAIQDYVKRTLLYHTTPLEVSSRMVGETISDLLSTHLITKDESDCYAATTLGQAIVAAALSPEDGIFMHGEFQRALRGFVMDGEMHVFYMFTPFSLSNLGDINWSVFRQELSSLDESGLRALQSCGVNPAFVNRNANSGSQRLPLSTPAEIGFGLPYHRFYTALQLRDLCLELPLSAVSAKYAVPRGVLQSLLTASHGTAASAVAFCTRMGWGMLAAALEHMRDRLHAEAKADLLELARIPWVKNRTARLLWENGYRGLRRVAEADVEALAGVLVLAQPRRAKTAGPGEEAYLAKMRERAEAMVGWAARVYEKEAAMEMEGDY